LPDAGAVCSLRGILPADTLDGWLCRSLLAGCADVAVDETGPLTVTRLRVTLVARLVDDHKVFNGDSRAFAAPNGRGAPEMEDEQKPPLTQDVTVVDVEETVADVVAPPPTVMIDEVDVLTVTIDEDVSMPPSTEVADVLIAAAAISSPVGTDRG
jgi:hypothetical protein